MNLHDRRGGRGISGARNEFSPERAARALREALQWREEWRAEMAERAARRQTQVAVYSSANRNSDAAQRRKFAEAIARAELGRAYWDRRLHEPKRRTEKRR